MDIYGRILLLGGGLRGGGLGGLLELGEDLLDVDRIVRSWLDLLSGRSRLDA